MLVIAGGKQVDQYGWYKVIIYPEIYVSAGWLAWIAASLGSLALLTLLLTAGGATATNWWLGGIRAAWVPDPILLVFLILAVLAPAALALWRRQDRDLRTWARAAALGALAFMLFGNAVESFYLARIFTIM